MDSSSEEDNPDPPPQSVFQNTDADSLDSSDSSSEKDNPDPHHTGAASNQETRISEQSTRIIPMAGGKQYRHSSGKQFHPNPNPNPNPNPESDAETDMEEGQQQHSLPMINHSIFLLDLPVLQLHVATNHSMVVPPNTVACTFNIRKVDFNRLTCLEKRDNILVSLRAENENLAMSSVAQFYASFTSYTEKVPSQTSLPMISVMLSEDMLKTIMAHVIMQFL